MGRWRWCLAAVLLAGGLMAGGESAGAAEPPRLDRPTAPDMVLLYYGFDSRGPRDWTTEHLKHYLARHEQRATDAERPVDTLFDTVLWMYRRSSRGAMFEASASAKPTTRPDWEECLDRLFAKNLQLDALEQTAAELERKLGRPIRIEVVLTLPYADVRVSDWGESMDGPTWDFRSSDEPRLQAARWYIEQALARWRAAEFKHLRLLGFYWFNESHMNMRPRDQVADERLRSDVGLMRQVVRHVHSLSVDGRPLTLTWIPYSPYGKERLSVVEDLVRGGEPAERFDYLMVQPNYFFPRHKKTREDLAKLVRAAASVPCGVEVECDESLVEDESARQRLRDYLEVIAAEHDQWLRQPTGYYQGLRAVYAMATRPELADLYDALCRFVAARKQAASPSPR